MIWILATRGAATKLRASPFTETAIEGIHSVVYKPGILPVAQTGADATAGPAGTFTRGLHRISGLVFSYHGLAAEALFAIEDSIDLVIRYRADGQKRKRTLSNVIFVGDAAVTIPPFHRGVSELIAVPFRVQIAEGEKVVDHVIDAVDA